MKKQIPNCAICKWFIIITNERDLKDTICTAQGYRLTDMIYNNNVCKNLFEVKNKK